MLETAGLLREHVDEQPADGLALIFRIIKAFERFIEAFGGMDDRQIQPQILMEHLLHLFGFMIAQQSVVHENAMQPFADRFIQKDGRNGGIDAAGQPENHFVVTDLRLHLFNRVVHP